MDRTILDAHFKLAGHARRLRDPEERGEALTSIANAVERVAVFSSKYPAGGKILFALATVEPSILGDFTPDIYTLMKRNGIDVHINTLELIGYYGALSMVMQVASQLEIMDLVDRILRIYKKTSFPFKDRFSGYSESEQFDQEEKSRATRAYLAILMDLDFKDIKRSRRKKGELPDPDRSSDSEINRLGTQFRARMSDDLYSEIEDWIKKNGLSKKEAAEYAFKLAMSKPYDPSNG